MPTFYRTDGKPVVQFDPQIEIAPFTLFRHLREGRGPILVDIRTEPSSLTLEGAIGLPAPDWEPDEEADIVLFDDDGEDSVGFARRLQEAGFPRVKALFGGLQLYLFALDPEALGQKTFLLRLPE